MYIALPAEARSLDAEDFMLHDSDCSTFKPGSITHAALPEHASGVTKAVSSPCHLHVRLIRSLAYLHTTSSLIASHAVVAAETVSTEALGFYLRQAGPIDVEDRQTAAAQSAETSTYSGTMQ